MQLKHIHQEGWPQEVENGSKVFVKNFYNTDLIMPMCFRQPTQVSLKPIRTFHLLNFLLHDGRVTAQLHPFSIPEPDIVVWLAFQQLDSFRRQRCVEVGEGFFEKLREEEKRWALVEAVTLIVDQGTASPGEIVLL